MVAALPSPSAGAQQHQVFHQQSEEENGRHPLALAEKNNGEVMRKPRSREITSRYKSTTPTPPASTTPSSSARRFPSPVIGRSSNGLEAPKRAVSAERRRPDSPAPASTDSKASTSRPGTPRAASRASGNADGPRSSPRLWPAAHNLSASLQVDSISRLTNSRAEGKDKPERGQASDHTLKPAANGVHRASDSTGGPRKVTPERKGTPERKRTPVRRPATDQAENARPVDNSSVKPDVHRWPVTNSPKGFGAAMSRSVDLSSDKEKPGNRIAGLMVQGRAISGATRPGRHTPPIRSLTRSINEGPLPDSPQSVSRHMLSESRGRGKLELQNGGHSPSQEILNGAMQQVADWVRQSPDEAELASSEGQPSVDNISDCDSISSGGSGATTVVSSGSGKKGTPGRRVNQDLAGRTRRLSDLGDKVRSSLPEQEFSAAVASVGKTSRRLKSLSISGGSPSTGVWSLSPGRFSSSSQPPSPSRMLQVSSPFRSMPSPTRTRVSSFQLPPNNRPSSVSSLLNFPIDVRKGKKAMSQQEEAQYLRILHNRWLQWCLVNARAEAARNSQKATAERSIYNAWLQTSELRKSVAMKRIKLQQARQSRKLQLILSSQGPQLENWAALQQEHSAALSGAMEALEAAVLRVPVTGGARADVQAIREALGFAVDVMGSVESSARSLMPRAERMDGLVSELAEVASQEKALLEDCSVCLDRIAALEIEERSLRTHFVQLESEQGRNSSNRGDPVPLRTPTRTC